MQKEAKIALARAAVGNEWGCPPDVFDRPENTFLPSEKAFFEVLTFGRGAAFRAGEALLSWAAERFASEAARDILDGENLYAIETALRGQGQHLCGEHTRYLWLDERRIASQPSGLRYVLYDGDDVRALYAYPGYDNALNYDRDVIAIAAFDGDTLAALAAADDHMEPLWQIGIDTLPSYRGRGLAAHLVGTLAREIVSRGRQPFYTTWTPNLASTRVALSCGFLPVWTGYYAEKIDEEQGEITDA